MNKEILVKLLKTAPTLQLWELNAPSLYVFLKVATSISTHLSLQYTHLVCDESTDTLRSFKAGLSVSVVLALVAASEALVCCFSVFLRATLVTACCYGRPGGDQVKTEWRVHDNYMYLVICLLTHEIICIIGWAKEPTHWSCQWKISIVMSCDTADCFLMWYGGPYVANTCMLVPPLCSTDWLCYEHASSIILRISISKYCLVGFSKGFTFCKAVMKIKSSKIIVRWNYMV